ncbi:hypothetical protein NDU88_005181 [Pleurodeles waltl]|uniref:Uncharacterized protein n=1 Tax=Pleurodeles waltl TaxID=8319 RepID=A0AAV7TU11_PLEWA|nr:hypothetical protein NDU88_005181 [Pleurodeles waltl]
MGASPGRDTGHQEKAAVGAPTWPLLQRTSALRLSEGWGDHRSDANRRGENLDPLQAGMVRETRESRLLGPHRQYCCVLEGLGHS